MTVALGIGCPVGHAFTYTNVWIGMTPILSEYACALAGTPQWLLKIGKARSVLPARDGPPSDPFEPRVSTTRQGGIETKNKVPGTGGGLLTPACVTVTLWPATVRVPVRVCELPFAATEKLTVPVPLPDKPLVIVSQLALDVAVQAHPTIVVTVTAPLCAPALKDSVAELSEYCQAGVSNATTCPLKRMYSLAKVGEAEPCAASGKGKSNPLNRRRAKGAADTAAERYREANMNQPLGFLLRNRFNGEAESRKCKTSIPEEGGAYNCPSDIQRG